MTASVSELYAPLIERDLAAIPAAVQAFRAQAGSEELFRAIARFSVLAFAPSQHAKHAMLSCLAAWDLREEAPSRFDDLIVACATYAAESRQPWSEPPIPDPPPIEESQRGDLEELRAAIGEGDRRRAERWLAKRIDDPALEDDFFRAAAGGFDDLGHKLIVAAAAWRLAGLFGDRGRYPTLRVAVWEWTAYPDQPFEERGPALDGPSLARDLAARFLDSRGSIEEAHDLFLLDAALDTSAESRVRNYLTGRAKRNGAPTSAGQPDSREDVPIYRLARDYAQALRIFALTARWRDRFPGLPFEALRRTARVHLDESPSWEEWSFA